MAFMNYPQDNIEIMTMIESWNHSSDIRKEEICERNFFPESFFKDNWDSFTDTDKKILKRFNTEIYDRIVNA